MILLRKYVKESLLSILHADSFNFEGFWVKADTS